MRYSLPEAAQYLGVEEDLIYDWIRNENLPATYNSGRFCFNRLMLLEWAYRKKFRFPVEGSVSDPILENALECGGVLFDIPGNSLGEALDEIFSRRIHFEESISRKALCLIRTRNNLGWSGTEHGVALPVPSAPLVLSEESMIYIAHLKNCGVDAQLTENIRILFVLLVSTPVMHLNLLSRCLFVLRDPEFCKILEDKSDVPVIMKRLRELSVEPAMLPLSEETSSY